LDVESGESAVVLGIAWLALDPQHAWREAIDLIKTAVFRRLACCSLLALALALDLQHAGVDEVLLRLGLALTRLLCHSDPELGTCMAARVIDWCDA